MQPTVKSSPLPRLLLSIALLAIAVGVLQNRTFIADQMTVWQYNPTSQIVQIAQRSSMSEKGTFLFYASRPSVAERDSFNLHCRKHAERVAVLGCYQARTIYIYNIRDQRLDGIKEVTAAHEMLHAAYDRLSPSERERVDRMVDAASLTMKNPTIEKKLALYDKSEPGERLNELHSMLGSEVKDLPAELETYYAQYFTNRLSVVALSEKYEQVFAELELRQKQLVDELNSLATQIDADNKTYKSQFEQLQEDIASFNERADNGSFSSQSQFNAERSRLTSRQAGLTDMRSRIISAIESYDRKRQELDQLNTTASGLQNSIDSSSVPEVPSL